ncbi:Uncharacterised protein [Bordetella pertussis]|nr:Uncharacterised protein [Bordetella pertussis]CPP40573.1 Uncharacterised protein [Bordetella pertussis]
MPLPGSNCTTGNGICNCLPVSSMAYGPAMTVTLSERSIDACLSAAASVAPAFLMISSVSAPAP